MADYEDHQLGVNVLEQDADHLINRWKFGAAQRSSIQGYASPLSTVIVLEVLGRGMVYGGYIRAEDAAGSQSDSIPKMAVDEVVISAESWTDMNYFNMDILQCMPLYIRLYNDPNGQYQGHFSYGITFEQKLEILYQEVYNRSPILTCVLVYTFI